MNDKDDLIMYEEMNDEYEVEEMIESEIDDLKAEYHSNLILLENLLKEINTQIETKNPQLIKLMEMIKCVKFVEK